MKKVIRFVSAVLFAGILALNSWSPTLSDSYGAEQKAESAPIGWVSSGNDWMYYQEDGTLLRDALTPEGYYMDVEGKWRWRTMTLLDEQFALPDTYRSSAARESFLTDMEPLERLNTKIRTLIDDKRVFNVYEDSIQYWKADSGNGTFLMGLYKNPQDGGWRLKLACCFNKSSDRTAEEACDYAVFRFFLSQMSHVPERVSEAIYDSWQGQNNYGIHMQTPVVVGDVAVRYYVEDKAAIYVLEEGMKYD